MIRYRQSEKHISRQEVQGMKGYFTESGYMGFVAGTYILFASEDDYRDYIND